jgi:hypothetical protein
MATSEILLTSDKTRNGTAFLTCNAPHTIVSRPYPCTSTASPLRLRHLRFKEQNTNSHEQS